MLEREELIKQAENAIKWIREYVENTGAKGLVIGNSGGKDSATVIAMATKAIGKENVITISMPCYSIDSDFEDAKLVADSFGVKFFKVDLSKISWPIPYSVASFLTIYSLIRNIIKLISYF